MTDEPSTPVPVIFCITDLDSGGAERALTRIAGRLERAEWDPTVICLGPRGEMADELESLRIPVIALGATSRWDARILFRLVAAFKRLRPAVVQTFLFHANLLGRLAARLAGVRCVVGGIRVAERRSKWYHRLDRWTEFLVRRQVCVSEEVRRFSVETARLSADKLLVIPNGIEVTRFETATPLPRQSLGCSDDDQLALCVGRLDPQKGMHALLDVAGRLRDTFPRLRWLLAGEGALRQTLQQRIREEHLEGVVRLLGRREDIPELMRTADLFVFPSLWEGQPNVVLEAMAARLPIVTTAVEGVGGLLEAGVSAEIVPPGDVSALASSVASLLENEEMRSQYAARAFVRVTACPTWESVSDEYAKLYRELLSVPQPAGSG
ncbi:MAG: glycosyltransferase [Planctomycetaceae bacterium]|nr:glycosyltransferase [Planctomycetaceae bacterium]